MFVPRVGESCHTKVAGTSAVHGVESDGKVDAGFTNMAYTAENGDTAQSGPRDGKGTLVFIIGFAQYNDNFRALTVASPYY